MEHPWAKYDSDSWHPLVAHSADVAAVLEVLLRQTRLGTRLGHLLGQGDLCEVQRQRLCVLAALHDAGKTNQGFQNRRFDEHPQDDHVTPIVGAFFCTDDAQHRMIEALGLRDLLPWFADTSDAADWLHTTWSHHGAPVEKAKPKKGRWTDDAFRHLAAFEGWTRDWHSEAFEGEAPPLATPQAQHLFNGALTLADWIASDRDLLPWRPDLTDPRDAIEAARECRVPKAMRKLHLAPDRNVNRSLRDLTGGEDPYDVQKAVQDLSTSTDGTLSILESATGSGKTEAALGRFARLLEENLVDSLYFAVPTHAAAKQLYERVKEARDSIFGPDGPPAHLAVPGYLKVDDAEGTRFGWRVRWDEDVGARGWAAESSKRYTASPIAVGTLDQVLLSALQRKHAHLRLAGLTRSLLVVDEVHASSIYMNEVLKKVLSFHCKALGGHALLMSATLGAKTRADFTGEDVPLLAEAKKQHYPLVSHVAGTKVAEPARPQAPEGCEKRVSLSLAGLMAKEDAPAVARRAEEAARTGAHVLVIRNTVKACQAVHRALGEEWSLCVEDEATPHHARYAAADREKLDERIQHVYGKHEVEENGQKRLVRKTEGGVVTVATQTVEQSLDIDADLLITDLCPMDVLLQRIGRLHRHDRAGDRPAAYRETQCLVLVPAERASLAESIAEDTGKGFPGPGLGPVYRDLRIAEATRRALRKRVEREAPIVIPRDNRTLVEEATHPEVIDAFETGDARWKAHARYVRTEGREEVLGAGNVLIDREKSFSFDGNQFPSNHPKTRLGQENVVLKLPREMSTPFGNAVEELELSPYLFVSGDERPPESGTASTASETAEGFAFSFAGKDFTYTARGIQKTNGQQ